MVSPLPVGTAIQHAGEAATTANRLSAWLLLADIAGTGLRLNIRYGPNQE
jgi:hypothetical protein